MLLLYILSFVSVALAQRTITFKNRCAHSIWINPFTSDNGPQLGNGIQRLDQNARVTYNIPNSGWKGRFWPKVDCDSSGHNCGVGQSVDPCPRNGCQPPADTKVEFSFPSINDQNTIWYDISLVDGYSLAMDIIPNKEVNHYSTSTCIFRALAN